MMSEATNYLTRAGYEELESKLHYLRTERRREVAERLHQALQEAGELGENAEYEDAKNHQAFIEGEIRRLEEILSNAQIIEDDAERPTDMVVIGSRVTLREKGLEETEVYFLVGPAEANPREGKISYKSPLGKALMDQKVGDEVLVHAPDGDILFEIIAIE
jgi:transcription elongation factor GreA